MSIVNKAIHVPKNKVRAVRGSFIVENTNHYCRAKTRGGLVMATDGDEDALVDKKFSIGRVIAVGSECKEIKVDDIVVYIKNAAWRIPNGLESPTLFKMEETPIAIACVLPPMTDKELAVVEAEFAAEEAAQQNLSTTIQSADSEKKAEPREKRTFTKKY